MANKRVLLKLSGEVLAGKNGVGIDSETLSRIADELAEAHQTGVEIGLVIGGGNIYRGISGSIDGIDRVSGDYMGMLATGINSLALQDALERRNVVTRVLSAIEMSKICEPFITRRATRHLEKGRVLIFACGTGMPFFSTDTAAALRAQEIGAEIILKGTKVDGVYDKDPEKHSDAKKFGKLSFLDVINKNLAVMDMTAVSLCMGRSTPIRVFNINVPGNLQRVVSGEEIGTLVS